MANVLEVILKGDAKHLNSSLGRASAKLKNFGDKTTAIGRNLSTKLTLPLALAGGAAVKMSLDFEKSMTKITTLVGVASEEVSKMSEGVKSLASEAGISAGEAADALFFITSAGLRGADAMAVLEQSLKAAAVGLGETKTIADLSTSAINAFGAENITAAQATDVLVASVREGKLEADELAGAMGRVLPIASNMGISFNEVGAAFAAMSRTGTNANEAATQLRGILSSILKPTSQAKEMLGDLGLSAEGLRSSLREDGLLSTLEILKQRFEGNDEAAQLVFGNVRALTGIMDLLGASVDTTRQIFENMTDVTGTTAKSFEDLQQSGAFKLEKAMATLKNTFTDLGGVIAETIVPVVIQIATKLTSLLKKFSGLDDSTKKVLVVFTALAAALPPLLIVLGSMSSGLGVLVSVGGSLIPILAKVASGFRVLGVALVTNPFGIAVAGIVAVTAAVTELMHRLAPSASRLTTLKNIFLSLGNPTKFAALQAESLAKSQAEVATETPKANTALEDYKKLLKESADASNNLTTKNDEATVATRELAKAVSAISLSTKSGELNYTTGEFAQADIARGAQTISVPLDIEVPTPEAINEKLKGSLDKLKETTKETAEAINIDFGNMAMGVAEALGSAISSGENVFASIGGVILNSIADILFQMGTAAVAASNLATTFAIPGVGLAAGLAAIGLGAAMKAAASQIQNVQKFAKGGIVSAPTLGLMGEYSGARSNPEVIAPLDKLKGMIGQRESNVNVTGGFRLEGQDLVMALQRADRNRSRLL
jgi:TP901 family phage tail tape measure protein